MTLDEIRKNRQQEEGSYSAMDEKTDVAVSSSRDIPDSALSVSNPFDVVNNNTTSEARFQIRQKRSASGHNFEEEGVCGDEDTVLLNRKMGSEKNDVTLTEPVTQIQLGIRTGHDGTETGENLIQNYKSDIVIKTLAQIRAEKDSLIENISSCIPKKRSHSPIVFDCLPRKLSRRNIENEKDGHKSGGEGKEKKPMIIRKHILEPGPNPDEKDSSDPPKKLRRFVRRTLHQQVSETKSDSEGTPRKLLKLRRNINTAVAASESSRVIRLTSDSLKNSEFTVEVPHINSTVCSDSLKVNGTFCVETGGSDCDRLGQPLTNISGDSFKLDSVSVTRSFDYDENCSTPFDVSRSDVSRNSDLSLRTTTDSPTTCVFPGKYPDTSVNELVGDRIGVTQSSKLEPSERSESKLAYTKNSDYMFGAKGKQCSVKPVSILPTERDSTDTDEELFLGSSQDNSLTLDAGEDILQDIDDLLNDD
jgi:hypothetical protein